MTEQHSVVIKLTSEQRQAIKQATGRDIEELKVGTFTGGFAAAELEQRKAPVGFSEFTMTRSTNTSSP